ncbi:MAG: radical SAM protein [Thermodesulfobacteriota bacterium]
MSHTTTAALLQPPPGDLTGPYPALPYLKAHAEQDGHKVRVWDTGIEAFHFMTAADRLRTLLDHAKTLRSDLEARACLEPDEQARYQLLASAVPLESRPALVADAVECVQNTHRFNNYRSYRQATRVLDAFFALLSAIHYPTGVTCAGYPTAQEINSYDGVLSHRDRRLNPYVAYYEDHLFPRLADYQPAVIGISMEFASQSVQALVLGSLLKKRFPESHITMGGAYLSQWVLLMGERQLEWLFTCTDSVVCGEGESAFSLLLGQVARCEAPDGVPNLVRRHNGRVQRCAQLEYPDIGDIPPPDFTDLDLRAYLTPTPIIPYAISRGCYWGKCAFCQNRYGENRMRRYQTVPVEKAVAEMSLLSDRHHTNHFNFSNDVLDPPFLERFSKAVIVSGRRFVWNTDLRADKTVTRELCGLMARAGLNSVAIGFESACQRTLDAMNKGKTVEHISRVMKDLYDHGVATQAMGILGFPGESEEEAEMTVSFLEHHTDRISYFVVGLLMVVPGSRLHAEPEKYGITSISYHGNLLMAPLPVWRSDARISSQAATRLYHRLGHLEDVYAIHEYPYVGALSTNHSFLYFRTGPDVLKRIRHLERQRLLELAQMLGVNAKRPGNRRLNSIIPRLASDADLYTSPFPLDRIGSPRQSPSARLHRLPEQAGDYLVCRSGVAVRLDSLELQMLKRVNGERSLKSILTYFDGADRDRLLRFLLGLVSADVVTT